MTAARKQFDMSQYEQLALARDIIRSEGDVLLAMASELGTEFCEAVELLLRCEGSVIVSGIGKAGLIGQKITATLASTCTRSHFLHPSEAMHGDLGRIHQDDVVLMLSHSGSTEEVVRLFPSLSQIGVPVVAITGNPASALAEHANVTLHLGKFQEADPLRLAPSSSTTAMLAMGDALALVTARIRGVQAEDFARFHPGGSLGRKLACVDDVMQPLDQCRVASDTASVRDVFVQVSRPGRRNGAVMLVADDGTLAGIFTDSDLARLFEQRADGDFDQPISVVMTTEPTTIMRGSRLQEAIDILASKKFSELPVTDEGGKPVGLIDITDVVGLLPDPTSVPSDSSRPTIFPFGK